MALKTFGFIDGENLLHRYEAMLQGGAIPKPEVIHIPGLLVWHPSITNVFVCEVNRISFYQTVVGDDEAVTEALRKVTEVRYSYMSDARSGGSGSLYPRLFKKQQRGTKTKSVDINICVDALRCVMNHTGDAILLLSGDGDYLPLVEEINRHGKQVWLGAFSNGLSRNLRFAADDFFNLDPIFFEPPNPPLNSDPA